MSTMITNDGDILIDGRSIFVKFEPIGPCMGCLKYGEGTCEALGGETCAVVWLDHISGSDPWPFVSWLHLWGIGALYRDAQCRLHGHRWSCRTDVGSESGTDHFTCSRCGDSRRHTYY